MLNPIEVAIRQAHKVKGIRCKHGAVLLYKSKVIAVGHNRWDPKDKEGTIHAEEVVLSKIPKGLDPRKLTLVVVRVNRFGIWRDSKPCKRCTQLILDKGIGKVIYTMEERL